MPRAATTTDVFNAIAESGRRDILVGLANGEASVNDLVMQLRFTQPQVSKHLSVLRSVGVVKCRQVGRQRFYRVHAPALKPVHDWVSGFEQQWNTRLDQLDDVLKSMQKKGKDK